MRLTFRILAAFLIVSACLEQAAAEPWASPGDMGLRNDLLLLNDTGVTNIPISAWPIPWGDVLNALQRANTAVISADVHAALERVRRRARSEMDTGVSGYRLAASAAKNPRIIRTFENTPRGEAEISGGLAWIGERFAMNLNATVVANPIDGDDIRPDGTYIGMALGNWMLSAGWQERWWGPGRDGSLILGTNARPTPGVSISRNNSTPFKTKWLRWMGPWTFTSFMGLLDDERVVNDAWLFGMRGSFRPLRGLEIGISRSAQWCGDDRNCDLATFLDLLLGKDNRGVNVAPEDEPGNQLGGFDVRWTLPKGVPIAVYAQWIGEDTRQGGPAIGSWLRQVGLEYWHSNQKFSHRTHFEVTDSSCRTGGFGFNEISENCAYEHSIYQTGYRYKGRSIGHSMDGDGLSYSLGSTLVQSDGNLWNFSIRHMEINRIGPPSPRHTLSATPQQIIDIQISHERMLRFGRLYAGITFSQVDDELSGQVTSDVGGFVRWSTQ